MIVRMFDSELCSEGEVQLSRIQYVSEQQYRQVEVCVDGTLRTICDVGWTANNTRVVCRQLGLSDPQGETLARGNLQD